MGRVCTRNVCMGGVVVLVACVMVGVQVRMRHNLKINFASGLNSDDVPSEFASLVEFDSHGDATNSKATNAKAAAAGKDAKKDVMHMKHTDVKDATRNAAQELPPYEVYRLRANVPFNASTLTEGPRRKPYGRENFDSADHEFIIDRLNWDGPRYVVGWKPRITQHTCTDGSTCELIHHFNIIGCFKDSGEMCGQQDDRFNFAATYDRGSGEFFLPEGYGIPIGPGTPWVFLQADMHMLVPPHWDLSKTVIDTSGFDLYLTKEPPSKAYAAIIGFTDEDMKIHPKQGMLDHVSEIEAKKLSLRVFKNNLRNTGVEVLAAHLHTHEITTAKYFEHYDSSHNLVFKSAEEPTGYGDTQSMKLLHQKGWPKMVLKQGDSMQVHCRFDTDKLDFVVLDGTSHGEEMCSALLMIAVPKKYEYIPLTVMSLEGGFIINLNRRLMEIFQSILDGFRRLI